MMVEQAPFTSNVQQLNTTLDPVLWEGKKAAFQGVFDGMDDKITKALNAIEVFQRNHPEADMTTQRNVEQAITSLSFALKSVLNSFDKNLRDLKKYKIGQKVEKASKGKHN